MLEDLIVGILVVSAQGIRRHILEGRYRSSVSQWELDLLWITGDLLDQAEFLDLTEDYPDLIWMDQDQYH